jgi:hypothetical protein
VDFEKVEEEKKQTSDHSISTKASSNMGGVPNVEIMDDVEQMISYRGKAYSLSR